MRPTPLVPILKLVSTALAQADGPAMESLAMLQCRLVATTTLVSVAPLARTQAMVLSACAAKVLKEMDEWRQVMAIELNLIGRRLMMLLLVRLALAMPQLVQLHTQAPVTQLPLDHPVPTTHLRLLDQATQTPDHLDHQLTRLQAEPTLDHQEKINLIYETLFCERTFFHLIKGNTYQAATYSDAGNGCDDIDECAPCNSANSYAGGCPCSEPMPVCTNTVGSYYCSSMAGYGDPHFRVTSPGETPVCLDVNAVSGSIIDLIRFF